MMSHRIFISLLWLWAIGFMLIFLIVVLPAVMVDWNILGAFAAGFVNPFASGYSSDVIVCWCILVTWILFEKRSQNIKYGWPCALLGIVPGVAVGFALYLIIRHKQGL